MKPSENELLVDIKKYCPGIRVYIGKKRLTIEKTAFVRLSVAKKLQQAQKLLPMGMNFVIRDAWRPAYIQVEIFYNFIKKSKKLFPNLSEKQALKKIKQFVAPWQGVGVSGHMTGGAIDIRLINKSGRRVPMVSRGLTYMENALPIQKKLPIHLQKNRQIMADVLRKVGFSNNIREYWHWSYGDYYWAKKSGNKPIYGVACGPSFYDNHQCPCESGKIFIKCHGK